MFYAQEALVSKKLELRTKKKTENFEHIIFDSVGLYASVGQGRVAIFTNSCVRQVELLL